MYTQGNKKKKNIIELYNRIDNMGAIFTTFKNYTPISINIYCTINQTAEIFTYNLHKTKRIGTAGPELTIKNLLLS